MPLLFGEDDLALLGRVRDAIDPKHLSNPGKILPDAPQNTASSAPAPTMGVTP
jgi:hypothetical protein